MFTLSNGVTDAPSTESVRVKKHEPMEVATTPTVDDSSRLTTEEDIDDEDLLLYGAPAGGLL